MSGFFVLFCLGLFFYFLVFFARINFCEETYFKYFAGIKFSGFRQKDILSVAVIFSCDIKKGVNSIKQRLSDPIVFP